MKYAYGTQFTRVYDKFSYHLEDMDDCGLCANFESRRAPNSREHKGHLIFL